MAKKKPAKVAPKKPAKPAEVEVSFPSAEKRVEELSAALDGEVTFKPETPFEPGTREHGVRLLTWGAAHRLIPLSVLNDGQRASSNGELGDSLGKLAKVCGNVGYTEQKKRIEELIRELSK